MSSYEDDLDDDLPCVSLSQSTSEKNELEMPPASQLASQRAREDAAERALHELHENNDPLLITLSRSTSQSSTSGEGEATLSAAVSALQVTEAPPDTRGTCAERLQLLMAMREHFPEDKFLDNYIEMLEDKPDGVDAVTEYILQGISSALISGRSPSVPGAAAWLLCVALSAPRALRVRRALHAILDAHATEANVRLLGGAVCKAIGDSEQLLAAYDVIRTGARSGADQVAAILLAHATARVLAQKDKIPSDSEPPSPLSSETVILVRAAWRKLPARSQLTLLRCAGRALAAARDEDKRDKGDNRDKEDMGDKGDPTDDAGDKMDTEEVSGIGTGIQGNNTSTKLDIAKETNENSTTESTETRTENTNSKESERGAALLAALAQPLPRAPAFDIYRQQVLTNVSKLQLLFRQRFTREPQEDPTETLNCSQNSINEQTDPEETPIKTAEIKLPVKITPMKLHYPILTPQKVIPKDESIKKTVKGQLKLDGFFKQETQVKVVKEERSPEPKRVKRQMPERCLQKSGRT